MLTKTKVNLKVDCQKYFSDMNKALFNLLISTYKVSSIDCIVATKRSGLMMGAWLSNKLNRPMFVTSEIPNIPAKFKQILLVDDKIFRGRQFRKYTRQLQSVGKYVCTMCLYIEGIEKTDIYVEDIGSKVSLFYERN